MRPPATPLTKIADIFKMKYDTFVKIYPILICRLLKKNKKKKNKNHSNLRYLLFLNEINKYMCLYIIFIPFSGKQTTNSSRRTKRINDCLKIKIHKNYTEGEATLVSVQEIYSTLFC